MRILIAEDDFLSRKTISGYLSRYGECDITADGMEATFAFTSAVESGEFYDLVCLDVMMPMVDGVQALQIIRDTEEQHSVPEDKLCKVIMLTALNDDRTQKKAIEIGCAEYVNKPIDYDKMDAVLKKIGLI